MRDEEFDLSCFDVTGRHDCQRDQENATRATLERVLADPSEPKASTTETALVTDAELARAPRPDVPLSVGGRST